MKREKAKCRRKRIKGETKRKAKNRGEKKRQHRKMRKVEERGENIRKTKNIGKKRGKDGNA
jgi:hypothetical protein